MNGRRKTRSGKTISDAVINRLPRYFRFLSELRRAGVERTSSTELSEMMGATASQIRQDLNCFGGFGQQGYGYSVPYLYDNVAAILGVKKNYNAIIVGTGNLGKALASSPVFEKRGVHLKALFDVSPNVIGKEFCGFKVLDMSELENYCKENSPDIAVLTVPRGEAKNTADRLRNAGIRGIWNFTNIELSPENVMVQNVHMGDTLMTLCYGISCMEEAEKASGSTEGVSEEL